MLKKLLKYDLENIYKLLVVFYGLAIFFAILTRIFLNIPNSFIMEIIGRICSGTTIAMMINILINNVMRLWVRFKNNFYGDESYLTHTLPVEKKTLYLAKFLTFIITLFTSFLVIGASLFIAYYSKENLETLKNVLLPIANAYGSTIIKILMSFLFIFFLQFANMTQSGYMGIILGHKQNNAKLGLSVLFGFISYIGTQMIAVLFLFLLALFNKDFMNLFITNEIISVNVVRTIIYVAIAIYTIILIGSYLINLNLFKKGVNVD